MSSIPASTLVAVNPSVIDAGSSLLSLLGLFLTDSVYMPSGQVIGLASAKDVMAYFGRDSAEYFAAAQYFKGNDGSLTKPSTLYFAAYTAPYEESEGGSSAFLRGASLRGVTLADLKEITSGTFLITVDDSLKSATGLDFSAATSFADVATEINDGLTGEYVEYDADLGVFFARSLTAGEDSTISAASGTVAAALRMRLLIDPIVLSQGSDGGTLTDAMNSIIAQTRAFSTFSSVFEPDAAGKNDLATWVDGQNYEYAYIAWDTDSSALIPEAGCLGTNLIAAELSSTSPIYASTESDGLALAAFVMGTAASIDFAQANGRISFAYKGQSDLVPTVTNEPDAAALTLNGYNFYGSYATKAQEFELFQTGLIVGEWKWLDTFMNQIYMNSRIQQVLMQLLSNVNSIPYNTDGYNMLRATINQPSAEFLNFGSIRAGIPLDTEQASIVNQQAGVKIDDILSTVGWYLQILPATSQARSNRTTPPMKYWYTDGGSIHGIVLDSINVL